MSREIRRVPKDWQHPRDDTGRYVPLFDNDYETAGSEWIGDLMAWENGTYIHAMSTYRVTVAELKARGYRYFWEYAGAPPKKALCRPMWTGPATCYQVYETVSEGTPVSTVFESLDEMITWLVNDAGYSRVAAERFAEVGWAMSAAIIQDPNGGGVMASDIESFAILPGKEPPK